MIELIKNNAKYFFYTWGIVIFFNQLIIFGGCFAPYCIIAALPHTGIISAFITYLKFKEDSEERKEGKERDHEAQGGPDKNIQKELEELDEEFRRVREERKKLLSGEEENEADPLKEMGDAYEKRIGKEFESKGNLVIYNGLLRGLDDKGVDLVVISPASQSINLIQCKNWHKMKMEHQHITKVYNKLTNYEFDFYIIRHSSIQKHLHYKKETDEIDRILQESKNYTTIRKTLYIATDQVVDLNIGEHLTMVNPGIFRYKDMKIAIVRNTTKEGSTNGAV